MSIEPYKLWFDFSKYYSARVNEAVSINVLDTDPECKDECTEIQPGVFCQDNRQQDVFCTFIRKTSEGKDVFLSAFCIHGIFADKDKILKIFFTSYTIASKA